MRERGGGCTRILRHTRAQGDVFLHLYVKLSMLMSPVIYLHLLGRILGCCLGSDNSVPGLTVKARGRAAPRNNGSPGPTDATDREHLGADPSTLWFGWAQALTPSSHHVATAIHHVFAAGVPGSSEAYGSFNLRMRGSARIDPSSRHRSIPGGRQVSSFRRWDAKKLPLSQSAATGEDS